MTTADRDGRVLRLLARCRPVSVIEVTWARPLRISAYLAVADLPDDLVVSVRCIVHLDSSTVEAIGFLHLFNLGEPLEPYPHPDVLQLVTTAAATSRQADDWTDLEGYELHSELMDVDDAVDAISVEEPMCIPYLLHLASRRR